MWTCSSFTCIFSFIFFELFSTSSGTIPLDLQEELPAGTLIFNLRERLQLPIGRFPDVKFQVVEQFLNRGGNPRPAGSQWIVVDFDSGDVTQGERIDRESLCGLSSDCYISVKMIILPQSSLRTESIHFYITDINDNIPSFSLSLIELSVPETSAVGFEISLDKAQALDSDLGKNASITYSLSPPSDYFSIHQSVDDNRYQHLTLVLEKRLDFENDKIHRLTLRASDGGSPPLSSLANMQIMVEDRNDNAPVFDKKQYSVSLREDFPTGTEIAIVHASDGDVGLRGKIRYQIHDNLVSTESVGQPSAVPITARRYPVIVNDVTGAVVLRDKLNHKLHDGLKIFIEAVDGDEENPRIGRTLLVLQVEDINDNSPVITVNFITNSRGSTGYVSENAKIGSFLAHVTATDADDGLNGDVTLSAETLSTSSGGGFGNFTEIGKFMITDEDLLVTGIKFDREKLDRYDVIIKAEDQGVPPKTSTVAITIVILDENEFAPKFLHTDLVFDLPENQEVGSSIGKAKATDMDDQNSPSWRLSETDEIERSLNGKVTYGLTLAQIGEGTDEVKPIRIAPDTGHITLTRSLDYETQKSWNLIVTARDGGRQPSLQSTCRLTINVQNVNDNEPTFVFPEKDNSTVYASTVSSSKIFTVIKALDFGVDEKTNLRYSFRILERNGDPLFDPSLEKLFRLSRKTGEFKFDKNAANGMDILGKYKMRLMVSDSGNPPRISSMTLYVEVVNTPLPEVPPTQGETTGGAEVPSTMIIVIIGAAAGGAIILFLLVIVLVVLLRKKKTRKRQNETDEVCQSLSVSNAATDEHPTTLKVRTRSSNENSLPRNGRILEDTGFDSSSTRQTSVDTPQDKSCRYCDASNSPKETQTFIENSERNSRRLWHSLPRTGDQDIKHMPGYDAVADNVDMTSDMGDQCTYMCKLHGHSDTCWMPQEDRPLMPRLSPQHKIGSQLHPKAGSYRKDSGCSVDTSSSNLSYYKPSKEKRHKDDVFLMNDSVLPDVIAGKARTLTYSDGSSMMSSNTSSGTSRQSKSDFVQSPKRTRLGTLRNSMSDSRGDVIRNGFITDQSTRWGEASSWDYV